MELAIIILNYKTPDLVVDCLFSLQDQEEVKQGRLIVVVVDNYSGDDSIEKIQKAIAQNSWEEWVKLVASPVNCGFSAGNNVGIKTVNADAYLLLNSDTIVRPNTVSAFLNCLSTHPEAGLISPRLEWPDGEPQISCFRYPTPASEAIASARTSVVTQLLKKYNVPIPVFDTPQEVEWTSFACVLIRQKVIEQIGYLDEGYFMYFEDIDYCRRAQAAGWKILHCPDARVVHLRGGSGSVKSDLATRKRPRAYLYASRARYFTKFYGQAGLWTANLLWMAGRAISLGRELIGNKEPHICDRQSQDIWINFLQPLKEPTLPTTKNS
ncbi:glycosyltransferase family 2 protein [Merismopedia glauca]|uniref:Glycosyltransferase family 2 protein n=1 Tax=Merismopedia glauca CCAP 1448/3 TaxID=1296344 RepID=A0A2T1C462_9CYAN|nr:glycosyltransferase family 2 protein [Merismopedia glauca]PSB03070.1 glycosyltransferase family 2 protein [Merismopedia glauca CCAP 1448/3]